jgi:hypothetical protein
VKNIAAASFVAEEAIDLALRRNVITAELHRRASDTSIPK